MLTTRELAILKTPPGPRYFERLERFVGYLRGFGIDGRGPTSNDRGLITGNIIKVIDNFEDGNTSQYEGDNDSYSITTSPTFEGSYALSSSSNNTQIWSTSGLNNYPSAGDTFSLRLYFTANDIGHAVRFGVQSGTEASNYYQVVWHNDQNEWEVLEDGNLLQSHSNDKPPSDEWQRWVVDWEDDGTIVFSSYREDETKIMEMTASSTTYTSGGVGFSTSPQSNSSERLMDYLIIEK